MQAANYLEISICCILCLCGLAYGLMLLKHKRSILLPDVLLTFSFIYCGVGPLVSYGFGYAREYPSYWTVEQILVGYSAIALFLFSLWLSNLIIRPNALFAPKYTLNGRRSPIFYFVNVLNEIKLSWILAAAFVVWGLRILQFSFGGGVSGMDTAEVMLSIPYPVIIFRQLFIDLWIVVLFYGIVQLIRREKKNYIFLPLMGFEVLFQALQGRRDLLYLFLIAFFVSYAIINRINWKVLFLALFGVVSIFTVYSKVFLPFRTAATAERSSIYSEGLSDYLAQGARQVFEGDTDRADFLYRKNMAYRPRSNVEWILTVTSASRPLGELKGESLFHAAMSALPRFFRPYQYWGDHASLIQQHFGMQELDTSDNYIANAYIDFGFPGLVLFAILLVIFLNYGLLFAQYIHRHDPLIGTLIFASLFFFAMQFEASLAAPFGAFRNLFVVASLAVFLSLIDLNSRRKGQHFIVR